MIFHIILNQIKRYYILEKEDTREVIDIKVLNQEIAETVRKIDALRAFVNEIVKELDDGE